MNIFKQFYAYLRLRRAVDMAEKAGKKHHCRFYVLPGENGKLVVADRKNFRRLRQKHWIRGAASYNMKDVADRAFYYTCHPDGTGFMRESERKQKVLDYYKWYEKSQRDYRTAKAVAKAKRAEQKAARKNGKREAKSK